MWKSTVQSCACECLWYDVVLKVRAWFSRTFEGSGQTDVHFKGLLNRLHVMAQMKLIFLHGKEFWGFLHWNRRYSKTLMSIFHAISHMEGRFSHAISHMNSKGRFAQHLTISHIRIYFPFLRPMTSLQRDLSKAIRSSFTNHENCMYSKTWLQRPPASNDRFFVHGQLHQKLHCE